MQLIGVDTQRAYDRIREMIITLALAPGALVDEHALAEELDLGLTPIREALKLLAHDNLIEVSRHQGIYVSSIRSEDLKHLSEVRVLMEGATARMAAERAKEDDILVMEALIEEQIGIPEDDQQAWFEIDHKLHQAIAAAAHNRYLGESLEYYFGLSQRLWYLVLPKLQFLSRSVEEHADLVKSIKERDPDKAEEIMVSHVRSFYQKVHDIIAAEEG
jgi:DNA-binding GntR family transcriptional regulator